MCSGRNGEADVVRVNHAIRDRLKSVYLFFYRGIIDSFRNITYQYRQTSEEGVYSVKVDFGTQ